MDGSIGPTAYGHWDHGASDWIAFGGCGAKVKGDKTVDGITGASVRVERFRMNDLVEARPLPMESERCCTRDRGLSAGHIRPLVLRGRGFLRVTSRAATGSS